MSRPRSPLAEAKKAALVTWARSYSGKIVLTGQVYDRLREDGISRAEVNAAVDALVQAGEAELHTDGPRVIVHLLEVDGAGDPGHS